MDFDMLIGATNTGQRKVPLPEASEMTPLGGGEEPTSHIPGQS